MLEADRQPEQVVGCSAARRLHRRAVFHEALGATEVDVILPPTNSGHYMGGHRMGKSRESSVTNSYLETHDVRNLFLASGGAMPTSGVSNPTLTTVALTMRMAAHILSSRASALSA